MESIKIKRVYVPVEKTDGFRVLVDRSWPRGIKKETANIDLWLKEIAPSAELRKWFDHEPEKWEVFRKKYVEELQKRQSMIELLQHIQKHKTVTLIYAAKDEEHNNALVLKYLLQKDLKY